MTTTHPDYDVTAKAHDDCVMCDHAAEMAIACSGVSGSSVAGYTINGADGTLHAVTVERTRCRHTATGCLCPVCKRTRAEVTA